MEEKEYLIKIGQLNEQLDRTKKDCHDLMRINVELIKKNDDLMKENNALRMILASYRKSESKEERT